jgi:hypothetical protein
MGGGNQNQENRANLYMRCLVKSSLDAIQGLNKDIKLPYQLHAAVDLPQHYDLYFPLTYMQDSAVDAQGLLFQGKAGQWHHGLFKDSFRDLYRVLGDKNPSTWTEAVELVTTDETTWHPSENFEALGIKFPASASLGWCAVVVLTLQLYLCVQLVEFKRKLGPNDPAWNVAWIGMYNSLPARVSFLASIALPAIAAAALGIRGLLLHNYSPMAWLWLILEVCVASALAIATYFALPRLGRTSPSATNVQ